jgi:glycosyltransferase involved in cell wall biosynthesis
MSKILSVPGTEAAARRLLSIVVPVYNEHDMLPLLLQRLGPILRELPLRTELVFVDDGSKDGSSELIIELMHGHPGLRLVKLSRNFGKEAALTAGIEHARGDAVIVMDADLQDPPEQIPAMVACWQSGIDVVLMQRSSRVGDSSLKHFTAWCYYRLLQRSCNIAIPVDTGDFRLMSRRAVNGLLQLQERNRYMKGLFAWVGMPTQVLQYQRERRAAGATKWNYAGLIGLALEGLTSFSIAPLRWATVLGLFAATAGMLFGVSIVIKAVVYGDPTIGYPSLVALITFLGGVQLLSIGIVGEYLGKAYMETKQRPLYLTERVVEAGRVEESPQQQGVCHAKAF